MGKVSLVFLLMSVSLIAWSLDNKSLKANSQYIVQNVSYSSTGVTAFASYSPTKTSANELIIPNIFINITYETVFRLRIRISDALNQRWEVPNDLPPYSPQQGPYIYNVTISIPYLGIQVVRITDNMVLFNLDPTLFFSYNDQDILFTNNLGYPYKIMGLGERVCPFVIPTGMYTLWSRDRGSPYDDGQSQTGNMYSVHPFFMIVNSKTGGTFGGLLYNSNDMSAIVNSTSLSFRTTGGIIDMWLFAGPEPEDVVLQYHQLIGAPTLLPYWSYGWHQSRYGYLFVSDLVNVVNNYTYYNIVLAT